MSPGLRRIGVLGAGALGCLVSHAIAKSHTDREVWLLSRSPLPGGVRVEGVGPAPIHISTAAPPVDLLIVLVKAYATAEALAWAAGAIGPATLLLTMQNGLGNAEACAAVVGDDRVLAGTTAQASTRLDPGLVRHAGKGPTAVAPWVPGGPAAISAPEIARMLTISGLTTKVVNSPHPLLWGKLAVNAGINALTAVLGVPNGELLRLPGARRLMQEAAREAGRVASALGVQLEEDPAERVLAVAEATAGNRSSMLQDLEAGRPTEVDAINGAVVRYGAVYGVPTPVNAALTLLIKAGR